MSVTEHWEFKSDNPVMPNRISSDRVQSRSSAIVHTAKAWAVAFDFQDSGALASLSLADTSKAPENVRRALAFYQTWEEQDLGNARILKVPLSRTTAWAVYTSTDGDDGFLEMFDARGKLLASGVTAPPPAGVNWDATAGAVRNRLLEGSSQNEIAEFAAAVDGFRQNPPGQNAVTRTEMNSALKHLVEKHTDDVLDKTEKAALLKTALEVPLHQTARQLAEKMAAFYSTPAEVKLTGLRQTPLEKGEIASAKVSQKGFPPRFQTVQTLALSAWNLRPSQVMVATPTGAIAHLMDTGLKKAEASSMLNKLQPHQTLYTGQLFEDGPAGIPITRGLAVFSVDEANRTIKALRMPKTDDAESVRQDLSKRLQREYTIPQTVADAVAIDSPNGPVLTVRWQPPTGGTLSCDLDTSSTPMGISNLSLPQLPGSTEEALSQRMSGQKVLSYANEGNTWWVAHQPIAGGPVSTSAITIEIGGDTGAIAPKNFTRADVERARNLALGLARIHGEGMVSDPSYTDAQRLEVALKTRFRPLEDMKSQDASSPAWVQGTDVLQFELPSVWGDNAIFVTFTRNGQVRLEDMN